jgi:hypothetical protein
MQCVRLAIRFKPTALRKLRPAADPIDDRIPPRHLKASSMMAPNKTKTTSTKDPQNNKLKTTSGNVRTSTEITVSRDSQIALVEYSSGKPDKAAYNQEQEKIKAEIEPLQVKLVCVVLVLGLRFAFRFGYSCVFFRTFCDGCRRCRCPLVSETHT